MDLIEEQQKAIDEAIRDLRQSLATPWMESAGMVESGDPDSSRHIDDITYG
jgi:hypothetical protein